MSLIHCANIPGFQAHQDNTLNPIMSDQLLSLQNSLETARLPVLDSTLERFAMLQNKATTTNQHLAEIIRADPGYTLALFRTVNQPIASDRDPVQTIEHAISMLGVARVVEIGQQLVPFSALPEKAQTALKKIYSQSMHAAQYFQALAIQTGLPRIPEHANTVRMMPLAEVSLWTNNSDTLLSHQPEPKVTLVGEHQLALDQDIRTLGQSLAGAWSLPAELHQALSGDFGDNSIPVAMTLAYQLAIATEADWHSKQTKQLLEIWSAITETPVERVSNTIHQLAAETARQLQGLELPQAAFFLFFPKSGKKAARPSQADTQQQVRKPEKKQPAQTNPLQAALTGQMKNMQQQAGVQRVLFAMLTPDKKQLKVRFVLGGSKQDSMRQFKADMSQRNLFSLLMEKLQGIHLTAENQQKYLPLIPASERNSLQTDNLFAMSLFVKNKPVGLFIADRSENPLNASQYKNFKQLCHNAAKALESL